MSNVISYSTCPVCGSERIHQVLRAKDYTVSGEWFDIFHCDNCTARFTQNIPAAEVIGSYYQSADYVSHSDTKKGLINTLYHRVRNHTLGTKKRLAEKMSGNQKAALLDVGAGTGAFAATMQDAGWQVTGLEPDETARENAHKNYGLTLHTLDKLFTLPDNTFDVITLWHVLEHVHDLHGYLSKFQSLLKEDGTLMIAVPNYKSKDAEYYGEYWAAYDVPRHLYHFSPQSMQALMQQHGFAITAYKPMWFDSFYVAMLSEKYKSGKNGLISAVWNGLKSNLGAINDTQKCSSVIYIMKKRK